MRQKCRIIPVRSWGHACVSDIPRHYSRVRIGVIVGLLSLHESLRIAVRYRRFRWLFRFQFDRYGSFRGVYICRFGLDGDGAFNDLCEYSLFLVGWGDGFGAWRGHVEKAAVDTDGRRSAARQTQA